MHMATSDKNRQGYPLAQGLYNPKNEHDACGVGFVVNISGDKSHDIIENGLNVLANMQHRGAEGADKKSGDGAGIMTQISHEFILLQGIPVPERGKYGTGLVFVPKDKALQTACLELIRRHVTQEGLTLMPIRDVPVNSHVLGEAALAVEPAIKQLFITGDNGDSLELRLFRIRKRIEQEVLKLYNSPRTCYIVSLSSKRIVYKGMLTSTQLRDYFTDLTNPYYTSALALVHSRFSTNTFPTWDMAQPFRFLGHNGEINTIDGNRTWVSACENVFNLEKAGNIHELSPIIQPNMSDSASLDNTLEFFVMAGMSLPRALAMLLPESFNSKNPISPELRGFYEYHSMFKEPWDGPAALLFCDGRYIGGMLDRNGLRPARYLITTDNMMIVASETGVLEIPAERVREKGRFKPGKILIIDTEAGTFRNDAEIKAELANEHPYTEWLNKSRVTLSNITSGRKITNAIDELYPKLRAFGYTQEDIDRVILPMVINSNEPIGSMGDDTPLAVFSQKPQRLFNYFRQRFAQVTNPPIDPLREEAVMSLTGYIGSVNSNLLMPSEGDCKVVRLPNPLLTNRDLDILYHLEYKGFKTNSLDITFDVELGERGLEERLKSLCKEAEKAVDNGCNYIILSDRKIDAKKAPIPSLLAVSAIHHYLIQCDKRVQTALIVESAEPREVEHFALLIGFGASAVCPYMAFAVIDDLVTNKKVQLDYDTAEKHYIKALDKGLLKIMSKSGISTLRSYRAAQMFESIGLSSELLGAYFKGITSPIEGITLKELAKNTITALKLGFPDEPNQVNSDSELGDWGNLIYRKGGEIHAWSPKTVSLLRKAAVQNNPELYQEFTQHADAPETPIFIRNLTTLTQRTPISIDEVEPAEAIFKRFVAGAMSFGAISKEAHETIAIAMNRLGGKSNTGEGGEDPERYQCESNQNCRRSSIKQVASGRFGVNAEYLVNADEIQIKVAQGAKPGEGGQLPGYKVDELVAKTRHSIPGITLISPPPHHDIYSIEDLSQLIFDLRNVNPEASISVKLVSGNGIGTIAAGVVKAKADRLVISGYDGGTGASPISSTRHAGMPLEIGLAEVQQTLMLNNLRRKVHLQADGQLKTGYDLIVAALLGAEEFAFGTSLLIALGCCMDRKCHANTCPVGIATQDEALRCKFTGKPEHIENYLRFLAEEVRGYLAQLGHKSMSEIIGRTDYLTQKTLTTENYAGIKLDRLFYQVNNDSPRLCDGSKPDSLPSTSKDFVFIANAANAIDKKEPVTLAGTIKNTDRSVGCMLSGVIAKKYGNAGLPDDTITISLQGSAGQSFGAFLARGITLRLEGDANDYVGKGLSGGKISLITPKNVAYAPEENTIAGNTLLYGATEGEVYINGRVGERFAVRNSGAIAVVEGVCDHCCEYMTGGRVVVLGRVGRNFAAGMSGGIAYVWNPNEDFDYFCNMEMVELALLNKTDNEEVHKLVMQHYKATESPLAARMLANWDKIAAQFIKVLPIEYKKILDLEKNVR